MHWFIDPIKNKYANFTGRASRKEFWMFTLFYVLIYIAVAIVGAVVKFPALAFLFSLGIIIPVVAITTRRLHDIGKSGWWQIIEVIPVIGPIVMIVWLVHGSDTGENKYGPNPKDDNVGDDTPISSEVAASQVSDTEAVSADAPTSSDEPTSEKAI